MNERPLKKERKAEKKFISFVCRILRLDNPRLKDFDFRRHYGQSMKTFCCMLLFLFFFTFSVHKDFMIFSRLDS